jgi:23S rRNA A2030 N6-methylase RlmJ
LFDERKELRRLQRRAEVKSLVLIASQLHQQGELLWCIRTIRVGLNGSGLLIANPPCFTLQRLQAWLPELKSCLAVGPAGGASARMLSQFP